MADEHEQWLRDLSERTGASVEGSDLERLRNTNEDDRGRLMEAYEHQYKRRGDSGKEGSGDDGSEWTERGYGSGRNETAEASPRSAALSRVSSIYSSGGGSGSTADGVGATGGGGFDGLLSYLQSQQQRQDTERASMREILMGQLGDATKPVDVNDPTIQRQLDPQKLALQRSAERQRSQLAARLASEGLLDSGTFDTGVAGIEEGRGESEAAMTGNLLGRELQARRQQVQQLLQLAMASGDAESARTLSAQLASLNSQMQDQHFGQQLDFNYDALGQQGALGMAGLNQQALLALLGAI